MNLPLVFDIALGLVFIYLILSLLTSELQELLATLLQWRAEHLKKSIEVLLGGGPTDDPAVQKLANQLYDSPLIQALNQEAKGPIATGFRRIAGGVVAIVRRVTGSRNVFQDKSSGPSYIPSEAFASALLQKLDFETLVQKVSEFSIRRFSQEKLALVKDVVDTLQASAGDDLLLENEFNALRRSLADIVDDCVSGRMRLSVAVSQCTSQLSAFIDNIETSLSHHDFCQDIIRRRLPYLRQSVLLKRLEPAIPELLEMILDDNQTLPPAIADTVRRIRDDIDDIPAQLRLNLLALARRVQARAEGLEDGAVKLRQEVEEWFNQSMQRASGVYRRNSKGVAILLGILMAGLINVDTFHIIDRLSKDSALRSAIALSAEQRAEQLAIATTTTNPALDAEQLEADLNSVKVAINDVLDTIPLPIGWGEEVLNEQIGNTGATSQPALAQIVPYLRRTLGWVVSGIALSMGASFWFDLLGKVIRVRNTGGKPPGAQS